MRRCGEIQNKLVHLVEADRARGSSHSLSHIHILQTIIAIPFTSWRLHQTHTLIMEPFSLTLEWNKKKKRKDRISHDYRKCMWQPSLRHRLKNGLPAQDTHTFTIACHHVSKWNLITIAVSGFIWIDVQVRYTIGPSLVRIRSRRMRCPVTVEIVNHSSTGGFLFTFHSSNFVIPFAWWARHKSMWPLVSQACIHFVHCNQH